MAGVPIDLLIHLRHAHDLIDRDYAERLDLEQLAAAAGISKFHFLRSFRAEYGATPGQHLRHRRIERAQDLLRATNLTVTEICHLVGFTSLGSFSSGFTDLVGVSPSAYQAIYAVSGAPHVPGCFVFMHGLSDRRLGIAGSGRAASGTAPSGPAPSGPAQSGPAPQSSNAGEAAPGDPVLPSGPSTERTS